MTPVQAALSGRDLRRAMSAFQNIAEGEASAAFFVRRALDGLADLIGSDLTTLSVCDLKHQTRRVLGRPSEEISEANRAVFDRHFREHPLVRFHAEHPRGPAQRVTDCVGLQSFRNSALFADYYRRIGINHVMALPLWIDRSNVISIVFNRETGSFEDRDRALADALRGPLAALYRSVLIQEQVRAGEDTLEGVAASGGWHIAHVSEIGCIEGLTENASSLLRAFFADAPSGSRGPLPKALEAWLNKRSRNWGLDRHSLSPFGAERDGAKLTVHFVPTPMHFGEGRLFMRREVTANRVQAADLNGLPLTPREREVMCLILIGRANAEIGGLLGISPRTVQKHVENIFDKLGVESRTAAAMHVMEKLARLPHQI